MYKYVVLLAVYRSVRQSMHSSVVPVNLSGCPHALYVHPYTYSAIYAYYLHTWIHSIYRWNHPSLRAISHRSVDQPTSLNFHNRGWVWMNGRNEWARCLCVRNQYNRVDNWWVNTMCTLVPCQHTMPSLSLSRLFLFRDIELFIT